MSVGTSASRRRLIEGRIIAEVTRYYAQFGEGMPMQVLSAKYARALSEFGFPEVILALEQSRSLVIEVELNGRRTVRPSFSSNDSNHNKAYWF